VPREPLHDFIETAQLGGRRRHESQAIDEARE
jgi:hypothetical protein